MCDTCNSATTTSELPPAIFEGDLAPCATCSSLDGYRNEFDVDECDDCWTKRNTAFDARPTIPDLE